MILCLVEHTDGTVTPHSLEMLALGRQLAADLSTSAQAVVIGPAGEATAETLRQHGLSDGYLIADKRFAAYAPAAWAAAVAGVLAESSDGEQPTVVLAPGSESGHEVMGHVAALLDQPLATNCVSVVPGEPFVVTRQRWGGSLLEEARLAGDVKLLTAAPNAFAPAPQPVERFAFREVVPQVGDDAFRVIATTMESAVSGVSLPDARLVVGGGRGVGSAEGFRVLEELAGLLGAAVGCSRAVTSAGWRPHAEQIGQTGERITADLYVACGISGAMQHIVGAKGARHILAINTDPDATIMQYADYAIIGDLHQVLPAITAAIKDAKGS